MMSRTLQNPHNSIGGRRNIRRPQQTCERRSFPEAESAISSLPGCNISIPVYKMLYTGIGMLYTGIAMLYTGIEMLYTGIAMLDTAIEML